MAKGMFVQCHGCGFTGYLDFGAGDFETQEKELNRMINAGWRFVCKWNDFICPSCTEAGGTTDKLYELVVGKPRISGELISYVELRDRAERYKAFAAMIEGGDDP